MSNYSVINLKTDPDLKKAATEVANRLGVSVSAVLNNELRRFATEQSVIFEVPEVPNEHIAKQLVASKEQIAKGDYHHFSDNKGSLKFLADELK
jgi:addiction module RelB/DinJ family antitoxin